MVSTDFHTNRDLDLPIWADFHLAWILRGAVMAVYVQSLCRFLWVNDDRYQRKLTSQELSYLVTQAILVEPTQLHWSRMGVKHSSASQLFIQLYLEADIIKGPHHWLFVRIIHRWPLDSHHKGPTTLKMFPYHDVIMTHLRRHLLRKDK